MVYRKTAADAKKKSEEPKMDDNADPSAGIMNVSIRDRSNSFEILSPVLHS